MKLHLNYIPNKPDFEINHDHKLLLIGSCFSENIGELMEGFKFKSQTNPCGILFNPLSIYNSLMNCVQQKPIDSNHILERGSGFFSFSHHSSINDSSKEKLIEKINQNNISNLNFIKEIDYLVITFGTAYYYKHMSLDICVANCHKQANTHFEKKLLTVNEIVSQYSILIQELKKINSKLKIIFTVSPVKYLKDGIEENNISKATLLLSVNEIVKNNPGSFYFPAYELVIDDLRDYRFYKEDMAHPNEQAIKYVWEKFSETYFNEKTKLLNEKINKLNTAKKHKTLHNNATENEKFQKHMDELIFEIRKMDAQINLNI